MMTKQHRRGFTSTSEERRESGSFHGIRAMAKQTRSGFTLIETFVAITVLLVSLAGPLTLAAQALRSAYFARDEITAYYLAQEGLEYARAVRDQNYLASPQSPWLNGIADCVSATCQIDFPNFSHTICAQGVCQPLSFDPATGLFQTKTGTASIYTRALTIVPVANNSDEVKVSVTMTWFSGGINRTFTLSEHLFNWI